MTPAESANAARAFGREVTVSRVAYRQFFDAWLAEARSEGRELGPQSFLHAQFLGRRARIAAAPAADLAEAVALSLLALDLASDRSEAAIAAVAAGLCDPPPSLARGGGETRKLEHRRALANRFPALLAEGRHIAMLQKAQKEAMVDPDGSLADPAALAPALMLAQRRLCRIETVDKDGEKVTGTGFLIGPSAVLTNWHVVEDLPAGPLPDDVPLVVRFDYGRTSGLPDGPTSRFQAHKDWLIASSPTGALAPPGRDPDDGWWRDADLRAAWRQGLTDLDFAVIRLKGAPGLLRGWYDLNAVPAVPRTGSCFALHHPNGTGRAITAGSFVLPNMALGARVFHIASTWHGSSGGLIIDEIGRPAALHYLGIGAADVLTNTALRPKHDIVNVAVPLKAIATALEAEAPAIAAVEGLTAPRGCLDGRRPVFGRQRLLEDLVHLLPSKAPPDRRVLVVRSPSDPKFRKPGKSFTVDILEALLSGPRTHFIRITADQVRPGAAAMARMLMEALPFGGFDLPEAETTEGAYDQVLVNALRIAIADGWGDGIIWLVIDDLDVHNLTDDGGRRFLATLYSRVRDIPQLRIALIGLGVSLASISPADLIESPLDIPDDIAPLFRDWLLAHAVGREPIPDAVASMLGAALASFAGRDAPLAALSQFTVDHLVEALKTHLGDA